MLLLQMMRQKAVRGTVWRRPEGVPCTEEGEGMIFQSDKAVRGVRLRSSIH